VPFDIQLCLEMHTHVPIHTLSCTLSTSVIGVTEEQNAQELASPDTEISGPSAGHRTWSTSTDTSRSQSESSSSSSGSLEQKEGGWGGFDVDFENVLLLVLGLLLPLVLGELRKRHQRRGQTEQAGSDGGRGGEGEEGVRLVGQVGGGGEYEGGERTEEMVEEHLRRSVYHPSSLNLSRRHPRVQDESEG